MHDWLNINIGLLICPVSSFSHTLSWNNASLPFVSCCFALFLHFASLPCHPYPPPFRYSRQWERLGQASTELEFGCRKTAPKATIDHLQAHNNSFINTYLKFAFKYHRNNLGYLFSNGYEICLRLLLLFSFLMDYHVLAVHITHQTSAPFSVFPALFQRFIRYKIGSRFT